MYLPRVEALQWDRNDSDGLCVDHWVVGCFRGPFLSVDLREPFWDHVDDWTSGVLVDVSPLEDTRRLIHSPDPRDDGCDRHLLDLCHEEV